MMNPSEKDIWSGEKCKKWLDDEIVVKGNTWAQFCKRLTEWHIKQYEMQGNPEKYKWADDCLDKMRLIASQYGYDKMDAEYLKTLLDAKEIKEFGCEGFFDEDGFCEVCGCWYKHKECQIRKLAGQPKKKSIFAKVKK